jgi:hypothetical protein
MSRIHRRLRAFAFLFVLFPLWWLQRTHANPLSDSSAHGGHGHPAKSVTPGGDDGARHDSGGDSDDSDGDDGDDGGDHDDCDDGGDRDGDDGGDDGDDDDGGCGNITDCNNNGVDDAIDIQNGTSQDVNNDGIPDECEFSIKNFCDGTGTENGGVDCPCGNNSPTAPSGCVNSTGHGASLTASGTASVSNDTVVLTATGIPIGKAAYFLFAHTEISGVTFGDGIRCVQNFQRIQKVAHSSGSDTFPAPNSPPISQQLGITAGELTFFQVIYRDSSGPCQGGANATNGVAILWGP